MARETLRAQIQRYSATNYELSCKINNLNWDLTKSRDELNSSRTEANQLRTKLVQSESLIAADTTALKLAKATVDAMHAEIKRLQGELAQANAYQVAVADMRALARV